MKWKPSFPGFKWRHPLQKLPQFSVFIRVVVAVPIVNKRSALSSSLQSLTSLFTFQVLLGDLDNTVRTNLQKQILGVCIVPKSNVRVATRARLATSLYFTRITSSFTYPTLKLVGAKNHIFHHWKMHGFARSCCRASRTLASRKEMVNSHTYNSQLPSCICI